MKLRDSVFVQHELGPEFDPLVTQKQDKQLQRCNFGPEKVNEWNCW